MAEKTTIILEALMNVTQVESSISRIQKSLKGLNIPKDISDNLVDSFSKLGPLLKDYKKQLNAGFSSQKDVANLNSLGQKINEVFNDIDSNFKKINSEEIRFNVDLTSIKNARSELTKATSELEKIINSTFDKIGDGLKKKNLNFTLDFLKSAHVSNDVKKVGKELVEAFNTRDIEKYRVAYEKLRQVLNSSSNSSKTKQNIAQQLGLGPEAISNVDKVKNKVDELLKILRIPDTTFRGFDEAKTSVEGADAALNQLLQDAQTKGQNAFSGIQTTIDGAQGSMQRLTAETSAYGQSVANATSQIQSLQQSTQYFFSLRNMINFLKRGVHEAIDTVKNLDAAMTETAVVTNNTVGDMWKMLPEYTKNATALGATIQDMYEATTLYYQQGLNANQAMTIATETMKMARIGGLDAADATDMMTAALRGFNMELNEVSAQRINDVYSNLAAKTASNTEELGTAMQRTASIAASAGMSFEGTAAFLAQAIETTREPAENLGTAMKTIVARFQEMKKNPLEMTEVEGEEVSYNKVDDALKSIGVSLKDANGQFRALDQVFLEISQKWNTLTQTQQRYIATTAAGSRQQSRFIAMMSNYERTLELMDYAQNSAGASQEQFDKTLESFEAKVNRLKDAWQQFTMGLADNKIIKTAIDGLTGFFNILNKILDKLSLGSSVIKSTLSLFTAFTGLRMGGRIANSLIGGLGGMIDPNSSWSAGARAGAIGSRSGGNPVLAGQIANPIVAAIKELKGETAKGNTMRNSAYDQYHTFKDSRAGILALSKEYNLTDIQKQLSGLNYSNQNLLMKSFAGTATSMEKAIMAQYYNKLNGNSEAIASIREARNTLKAARNDGKLTWSQYFEAISDERVIKAALGKGPGAEAAKAVLDNITQGIKAKGQTAYDDATKQIVANMRDAYIKSGREEAEFDKYIANEQHQNYIHQEAEKARIKAEREARDNVSASNNRSANVLNNIGKVGSMFSSAGLGIQAFATVLTSSANPAVQAFGAAVSSVGGLVYSLGMSISGIGSTFNTIVESQTMQSLARNLTGSAENAGKLTSALGLAVAAIGLFVYAIKKHRDNIKKAAEEVSKTYKESNDKSLSNIAKLEDARGEFLRLSEGVDKNGNNVSLDSSDYNRYREIINQIAELNPAIIEGYNSQGDAIIRNNDALEQTLQLQKQIRKEAVEEYTSPSSLRKIIKARDLTAKEQIIGKLPAFFDNFFNQKQVQVGKFTSPIADNYRDKRQADVYQYIRTLERYGAWGAVESQFGLQGANKGDLNQQFKLMENIDKIDSYVNSLDLSEQAFDKLNEQSAKVSEAFSNLNDVTAETYNLLSTYATEQGFGANISPEYQSAFQRGIQKIAQSEAPVDEMFENVGKLYHGINEKIGKNSKIERANKAIKTAQDNYVKNLDEHAYEVAIASDEIQQNYQDVISDYRNLANSTGDETYNILADILESQLAKASDITGSSLISLNAAFDSVAEHIEKIKEAAKNFGEIADNIDPNAGAKSLKSIYDIVYDENSTHAQLHDAVYWEGVKNFVSRDLYNSGNESKIDKLMAKIKPALEEGADGVLAANNFFRDNADGVFIKAASDGGIDVNINNDEELKEAAEKYGLNPEAMSALLKRLAPLGVDFTDYDDVRKAYVNDERVKKGEQDRLLVSEENARTDAIAGGKTPDEFNTEVISKLAEKGIDVLPTFIEGNTKNNQKIQDILTSYGIDSSNYIKELLNVLPKEELQKIGENLYGMSPDEFSEIYDNAILEDAEKLDVYRNDKLDQIVSYLSTWAKEAGYDDISQGKATDEDFQSENFKTGLFGENGIIGHWLKGENANGDKFLTPEAANSALEYQQKQLENYRGLLEKGLEQNLAPEQREKYESELANVDGIINMLNALNGFSSEVIDGKVFSDFGSLFMQALESVDFTDGGSSADWFDTLVSNIISGQTPDSNILKNLGIEDAYQEIIKNSQKATEDRNGREKERRELHNLPKAQEEKIEEPQKSEVLSTKAQQYMNNVIASGWGDLLSNVPVETLNTPEAQNAMGILAMNAFKPGMEIESDSIIAKALETLGLNITQAYDAGNEAFKQKIEGIDTDNTGIQAELEQKGEELKQTGEEAGSSMLNKIDTSWIQKLTTGIIEKYQTSANSANTTQPTINVSPQKNIEREQSKGQLRTEQLKTIFSSEGAEEVKQKEDEVKEKADKGAIHTTEFKTKNDSNVEGKIKKLTDTGTGTKQVKVGADTSGLDNVSKSISSLSGKQANIPVGITDKVTQPVNSLVSKINSKRATLPVYMRQAGSWTVHVTERAKGQNNKIPHVTLPSFGSAAKGKHGTVGPKNKGGLTLTGEEGYEIAWLPRESKSMILGANGPQMLTLPSDAIIYTHEQSKEILKRKGIPAGSHASVHGHTDLSALIGQGNQGGSYSGKRSRGKKGGSSSANKKKSYNNWSIEEVIRFDINQNLERLTSELARITDKIEVDLSKIGTTAGKISDVVTAQLQNLKDSLKYNEDLADSYQRQLDELLNAKTANYQISYTQANGKSANKLINPADYIFQNEAGTYEVDVEAIKKLATSGNGNTDRALEEAVFNQVSKVLNELQSGLNKTADTIADLEKQIRENGEKISEAFYRWENELTRVYDLSQRIADETSLTDRFTSQVELELSKLNIGFGVTKTAIENIQKVLARSNNTIQSQIKNQQEMIVARREELEAALSTQDEFKKLQQYMADTSMDEATKEATVDWARQQYIGVELGRKYVSNLVQGADGHIEYEIDWAQFNKDQQSDPYNKETYDAIKQYLDDLNDKATEYNDSIKDQSDFLKQTYDALKEYQQYVVDAEETLIKGTEEQIKEAQDNAKKISDSVTNALKDLLDEVKRKLDERRKAEDNAKTEQDISQKQQRLAALRADTAGGHQVEIAQLEKEIADAQQSYQRTLEDQLLDRLSQQADEAAKQRERQIELAEVANTIAGSTNKELVDMWLKDPVKYKEQIMAAWLEAQGFDEAGEAGQAVLLNQFEAFFAELVGAVEQSGFNSESGVFKPVLDQQGQIATDTGLLVNLVQQLVNAADGADADVTKLNTDSGTQSVESEKPSLTSLYNAGVDAKAAEKLGYGIEKLLEVYKLSELQSSGYKASDLVTADKNLTADKLKEAGYGAKDLKDANFTIEALKDLFTTTQLKQAGFTNIEEFGKAGIEYKDVSSLFSFEELAKVEDYKTGLQNDYNNFLVARGSKSKTSDPNWGKLSGDDLKTQISRGAIFGKSPYVVAQELANTSKLNWSIVMKALKAAGYEGKTVKSWNPTAKSSSTFRKQFVKIYGNWNKFEKGGLANFTGPAWLDGTPSRPELVLNAKDTQNFLALRDVLSKAVSSANSLTNSYGGDAMYEININVDHIASDYDVDKVAERVKKIIVKDSGYRNVTQVRNFR